MGALESNSNPGKEKLLQNIRALAIGDTSDTFDDKYQVAMKEAEKVLTAEQLVYLNSIRKNDLLIPDDIVNLDSTGFDVLDGFHANLVKGQLGLVQA